MNKELEKIKLKTLIFEALGEASLQWEPKPTGVFDSTGAIKVGEKLYTEIDAMLDYVIERAVELSRQTDFKGDFYRSKYEIKSIIKGEVK